MSSENSEIRIGRVIIDFDQRGSVILASFVPEKVEFSQEAILQQVRGLFSPVEGGKGREGVKTAAELVFGAWFNQMNEIELADREKYEISSSVLECEEYLGGGVKKCVILFTFREREVKEVKSAFSAN